METDDWPQDPSVNRLLAAGEEFNFFQAIRLLEGAVSKSDQNLDLRFKGHNSAAFRPNFIEYVEDASTDKLKKLTVTVNGFHLLGQQGPLPDVFSEMLFREERDGNNGPTEFVNIFNDRILHTLYDVKKRFNPMLFNGSESDREHLMVFESITGIDPSSVLAKRLPTRFGPFWRIFSNMLANRRVNYSLILNVLRHVLEIEVEVIPCIGAWKKFPPDFQFRLDGSMQLGVNGGLGSRHWDNTARIGIKLRLDSIEQCDGLLPGGEIYGDFCALVSILTDGLYDIEVELVLAWHGIPKSFLSRKMKLGQTSWLRHSAEDPVDIRYPTFLITPGLYMKDEVLESEAA